MKKKIKTLAVHCISQTTVRNKMEKFKVLSIDAWAESIGGEEDSSSWSWNNWFNFGEYDEEEYGKLNETNAKKYFADQLADSSKIDTDYEIEDDQYNLVLLSKNDLKPILAIEYGGKQ